MIKFKDIEYILEGSDILIPPTNDHSFHEETMFNLSYNLGKPSRNERIGNINPEEVIDIYENQYKVYNVTPEEYQKHMIDSEFVSFDNDNMSIHLPTYNLNEYGFRTDDFNTDEEGIICLGCSDTFGDGQFENKIWPRIVSNKLDLKCYNLAFRGASLDGVYRTLKTYIHKLKSRNVFLLTPSIYRTEYYEGKFPLSIQPSSWNDSNELNNTLPDYLKSSYFDYINNMSHMLMNYNKNMDAIKNICHQYGMDFFVIPNPTYYDDIYEIMTDIPLYDRAADGIHNGILYQRKIANKFIEMHNNGEFFM